MNQAVSLNFRPGGLGREDEALPGLGAAASAGPTGSTAGTEATGGAAATGDAARYKREVVVEHIS